MSNKKRNASAPPENAPPGKRMCNKENDDTFVKTVVDTPLSKPLSDTENVLLTNLTRRALFQSGNGTFHVNTGGQPLTLVRVHKQRVETNKASERTIRRRTLKLSQIHNLSCGESPESIAMQQGHEFKRIKGDAKETFYERAGIKIKPMSALAVLAMKESTDMTWDSLREQRRHLRRAGMKLPSEASIRKAMFADTLYATGLQTSIENFVDKEGHPMNAAFGRVSDLGRFVEDMLDQYEGKGQLTWHNGIIPNNEIWVKFGGDHGKGSMKYTMQIVNTQKPNSKHNTFIVGKTDTKDNHKNMKICMSFLWPQLEELINRQWKGKIINLFIFGDYEFETKLFGLSGATGTHPCLWCLASQEDIQTGNPAGPRTLEGINADHRRFCTQGKKRKKDVKDYHNCLHKPMINIDTSAVAPPYLHILLGIVLKHHRMLEAAVQLLDELMCDQYKTIGCYNGYPSQTSHGGNWKQARELKNIIAEKASLLFWLKSEARDNVSDETRNQLKARATEEKMEIDRLENELLDLEHKPLEERKGPLCVMFDEILLANAITPQAYHSRAFVGNHCHRYLVSPNDAPPVYLKLTSRLVKTVAECTEDKTLRSRAQQLESKFNTLNQAYMEVHKAISHSKPISPQNIHEIQRKINNYMHIFRTHCPETPIIPKQHILEMHCIPWIQTYGFGMGLMGEQGGELIHASVARLERRVRSIRNPEKRMDLLMKTQHLQCCPNLNALKPPKQTRISKKEHDAELQPTTSKTKLQGKYIKRKHAFLGKIVLSHYPPGTKVHTKNTKKKQQENAGFG